MTTFTKYFRQERQLVCALIGMMATLFVFSGCSQSEDSDSTVKDEALIETTIKNARSYIDKGDAERAKKILENLNNSYPSNPDILENLAYAYSDMNDPYMAAFYFENVVSIAPQRSEMLIFAADQYHAAGEPEQAAKSIQSYLDEQPNDTYALRKLANLYRELEKPREALDAYLAALEGNNPTAAQAAQIGTLYAELGNSAQAKRYYQAAAKASSDDDRYLALAGLLRLAIAAENWQEADQRTKELHKIYPTRFADSGLEDAAQEALSLWRQEMERERLAREAARRKAEQEAERKRLAAEEAARKKREAEEEAERKRLAAQQAAAQPNEDGTLNAAAINTPPPPESFTPQELLQQARDYRKAGNYTKATDTAWKAVGIDETLHEAWFELSLAYYENKQYLNAEATCLEAIRAQPDKVEYTLGYLKIIQDSQPPDRLMRELHRAHSRLPSSPEIKFLLARGYEEIEANYRNAVFVYKQFLDIAPKDHPKRPEAEAALIRLN